MKTREYIDKIQANRWVRTIALGFAAFIVFSYMYTRGISPVWAAVAIVCFRGFFRFLYRIACLLVAAAILFCILTEQSCLPGRLFLFSALCGTGNHNDRNKRKRDENTDLAYRKLPGKVGKCLCSDGKVKPCGFGKNHPRRRLAVFFPKTLPYRRHLPSGPCSSRAAKARIFTIKKNKET